METLSKTQQTILDYVIFENRKQIDQGKLEGIDTINVAIDLKSDRGNTSRNLNSLYRKGHIIKIEGRPTLYVGTSILTELYPNTFIPATFSNIELFKNFLKLKDSQKQQVSMERFIGINPGESLQEPYELCVNSLSYPPNGIDIFLTGQIGVGKLHFVKSVFMRLLERNYYNSFEDLVVINCRQVNQSLFAYLDGIIYKNNHRKLFVLNNIENLDHTFMMQVVEIISAKLNNISNYLDVYKKHHFIIMSNQGKQDTMESFQTIFPTKVRIPNFDDKTIREKALFIVNYFLDEAQSLNKKILLSKKALNHFLFASYQHNLLQLHSEIKFSTLSATSSQNTKTEIRIDVTNLSKDLLATVKSETADEIQKLEQLYQYLPYEYLIINATDSMNNMESLFPLLIAVHDSSNQTIVSYCKQLIRNKNHFVLQFGTNKIYQAIEKSVSSKASYLFKNNQIYGTMLSSELFNLVSESMNINNLEPQQVSYKIADKTIVKTTLSIVADLKTLTNNKNISFIKGFIETYLSMVSIILSSARVQLLLVSKNDTVKKTYTEYAKSFYAMYGETNHDNIHGLILPAQTDLDDAMLHQTIVDKSKSIHEGKGVYVLLTDGYSDNLIDMLNQHSIYGLFASKPITHKTIEHFVIASNDPLVFADDIESHNEPSSDVSIDELTQKELKQIIMDNALIANLTYVNPHKIIDPVIDSFFNVCHDLAIGIGESLYIKYVVHLCFMLERALQNDCMHFQRCEVFEAQHQRLFLIIKKSLSQIQTLLDIKEIHTDEIAYLAQILLEK